MKKLYIVTTMIILITILALSTHALILQFFKAPMMNIDPKLNQLVGFVIRFATVIGATIIYFLSEEFWSKINPIYRVILFALLIMVLTEQLFRTAIMEIVIGVPWKYQAISTIPSYVGWLTLSLLVCFFMSLQRKNKFIILQYIVFCILTTAAIFFIKKLTNYLMAPLLSHFPPIDMSKLHYPPYGMKVMIPSYVTFLEPAIGSWILFYIIKEKMMELNPLIIGLIIGGILIIIHGGIYSMLQIIISEGNIFYRIFYYGQFLWEYLSLGILTACGHFMIKDQPIWTAIGRLKSG